MTAIYNANCPAPSEPQPTLTDEKPATVEQIAVVEFEAIDEEIGSFFEKSRWAELSRELGNNLRFAAAFVRLSKPELIDVVRKLLSEDDAAENYFEVMPAFENAAANCRTYADVLTAAHTRLLVAGAAVGLEPDEAMP